MASSGALKLRIGHTYSDRIAPLLERLVSADGVSLEFATGTADDIFFNMLHSNDFDAAEMSLGAHAVRMSRLDCEFAGLPVFPSRAFRHGAVFVGDGITSPSELVGKRIGTPEYLMTASIWVRHFLLADYGVDWRMIHWYIGGLNESGRKPRISMRPLEGLSIEEVGAGQTLSGLLEDGFLDAIIAPQIPNALRTGHARRLFEPVREAEEAWYRRTGVIPIMHLVVVRRALLEAHPALAEELTAAFAEAQLVAWQRLTRNGNPSASLVWLDEDVSAEKAIVGPNPFRYGIDPNRAALELFLQACTEQELLETPLGVDDLFWPSTVGMVC